MAFTFTDGAVATAAQLNQAIGPVMLSGIVKITPVANAVTQKAVVFPSTFTSAPNVQITPVSTVAGGTLKGWAAINMSPTGFTVAMYRTNTVNTSFHWVATLPPVLFATGQPVAASLLNQGAGGMVCQAGSVVITPDSAGTPKSANITYPTAFAGTPLVLATALATAPDLILGTAATSPTATGCKIWLCRGSTTATTIQWIAVGRM